ncbi:MAG: beta-galactosidase trimerization domain-containing protein [Limisphaerales bacterium]
MNQLRLLALLALLSALSLTERVTAQEQIDKADARAKGSAAIAKMAVRVRVTRSVPEPEAVRISWRRGGEGLGGTVTRGPFLAENLDAQFPRGTWSGWLPLGSICANTRGWAFPTIVVEAAPTAAKVKGKASQSAPLESVDVEFEFAESGKVFHRFVEPAPQGASVGFAFPGAALGAKVTPEFVAQLNGLSTHARLRRERLEQHFREPAPLPKQFALIGHLGGYGQFGTTGLGGPAGYGVRHCNPAILADECRTLRMLGVNSFVGSLRLADAAGFGADFRQVYWGGPGSGSPINLLQKGGKLPEDACPFDPALVPLMQESAAKAIAEHQAVGAKESWALWVDEIGVFAKEHIARCDRCAEQFRIYLRAQKLSPGDFGQSDWNAVKPFDIGGTPAPAAPGTKTKARATPPATPETPVDSLRSYYTARFMTHATAQVFPERAKQFKAANIPLYAMQGPTPSWNGSSLDWHEFYDHDANAAFVWETSNRDPRAWQWESYLADIGRGIAARHSMPMGCLVKPHRGAPEQRMLAVVTRGVRVIEWYTYGPDYSKGDSFSQSPELLERVAGAARFLGRAEPFLYGARPLAAAEVAFVSPRASELWGRAGNLNGAPFENAKWVYLALAHAHIPVDILSEQQLAEGKLARYKAIYVPGPHLRRDAAAQVKEWVRAGGSLWTDALGLAHDEANQPATAFAEVLGLGERKLESWGAVEGYRATDFKPLAETNAPAGAALTWDGANFSAGIGREPLVPRGADVRARFADGQPAVTRHKFGKGDATVAGLWAGLTYSAKVRRADFSMREDFSHAVRALITAAALARNVARPALPADPLVESVALVKDGQSSVALMNWAYKRTPETTGKGGLQTVTDLRVALSGLGPMKSVRSLVHGPLALENGSARLPKLAEIDLLIIE